MNLPLLLLSAALSARPASAGGRAPACRAQKAPKRAALTYPSGKTAVVDVVDTPRTREIGLMCRTRLGRDYGMLFVFPGEMDLDFWMKNTLVSLDMVWIGSDKRITAVHARMKASRVDTPDAEVARAGARGQYVLELPAGAAERMKLKPGDALRFDVPTPPL